VHLCSGIAEKVNVVCALPRYCHMTESFAIETGTSPAKKKRGAK